MTFAGVPGVTVCSWRCGAGGSVAMRRAARIADLGPQPARRLFHQLDGIAAGVATERSARLITGQQLHQGGSQQFSRPAGALGLERMPLAIADAQLLMQLLSQLQGPVRPVTRSAGRGKRTGGRRRGEGSRHPGHGWTAARAGTILTA